MLLPSIAYSTETVGLSYRYKHLDFAVVYNDGTHRNGHKLDWYYRGMSEQLHQYIEMKINRGELENKKFSISFWLFPVAIYDRCPIELTQNKYLYDIYIVESELNLEKMVQMINYFASEKWESFVCVEPKKYQTVANKTLFKRMDNAVGKPDMSFFNNKKTTVFQLKNLQVFYENDSLSLSIDGYPIGVDINFNTASIPPQMIGSYYLVASDDSLYIYDNTNLINQHKRPIQEYGHSLMVVYATWMNYYQDGYCPLSYSLEENRFYDLKDNP
jgi:hypothetical protein